VYNLHLNKDDNDEDDPMVENYKKKVLIEINKTRNFIDLQRNNFLP